MTREAKNSKDSELEIRMRASRMIKNAREIPVSDIHIPKKGRRKTASEELDMLADSMQRLGLLNPITVCRKRGKYEVIAGRRRLLAAQKLEWATIPTILMKGSKKAHKAWRLIENICRAEVTFLERAEGLVWLVKSKFLKTQASTRGGKQKTDKNISKAAQLTGLDRRKVQRLIPLAKIAKAAKKIVRDTGLDNKQVTLQKIAKQSNAKQQVEMALELSKPKAPPKKCKAQRSNIDWYGLLCRKFAEAPRSMRIAYARLSPAQRNRFANEELAHLAKST